MAEEFNPDFKIELQGRARAYYRGPRTPRDPRYNGDIEKLHEFFLRKRWRGQFVINYSGNGGVTDIVFDEIRRMKEDSASNKS